MSLINDALRKARQAAAEHEELRTPQRAPRAYPGRGRDSGPSVWLLAAVAAVAAGAGGTAVWWLTARGPGSEPAAQAGAEPVEDFGSASLSGAEPGATPDDGASTDSGSGLADAPLGAASRPGTGTPADDPGPAAIETAEVPAAGDTVGADTARGAASAGAGRAVSEAAPSTAPGADAAQSGGGDQAVRRGGGDRQPHEDASDAAANSRVFVLDARVDGRSLSLGYIVFRPVRPFAEINGDEVYEGSEVAGFTVEKIEADRVILRDARGPLELRTR